jgi:tetratricopeptide (TPR) repeat protein
MLLPQKKSIFLKRKHTTNPYRVVILVALLIAVAFVLRGIRVGTIVPLAGVTPTPTRTVNSYALEGETQFQTGNLVAAIDAYRKAVEIDPTNAQILAELARIQTYSITLLTTDAEKSDRMTEAQQSINQALALAPDDSSVYAIKAFVLDWSANTGLAGDNPQGLLAQAEQAAIKALQLDNTNALALAYYAEILVDQQKWTQAQGYIGQAIERDPSSMDVHRINAYVYESIGAYSQAIDEYLKAIVISPNLTFLYLAVGANYRQLAFKSTVNATVTQLYDEALTYFAEAATINTRLNIKDPIPYLSIAKTYSQMGEFFSAALNVRKALTFNPTSPDIYGQLGIVYFKSRNYEGSIPALQCALIGCDAQQACDVRRCDSTVDPMVAVTGMPLSDTTVVYYYTYGSVLAAMHRPSNGYCAEAMQVLAEVKVRYGGDATIAQIIKAGEDICISYGYKPITLTPSP